MKKFIPYIYGRATILFFLSIAPFISYSDEGNKYNASLPIGFEENRGQFTDENGKPVNSLLYKLSVGNLNVYLTEKGISYILIKPTGHKEGHDHSTDSVYYNRVDVELNGAIINKGNIREEDPLETEFNYFLSHCPNGITSVKKYRKITVQNIYPNIDWVWYLDEKADTKDRLVKYDFVIRPGGDPSLIRMNYKWADVETENGTQLSISTPINKIIEGQLVSYCGDAKVKSNYKINGQEVSFNIGNYDNTKTLTIDPPLALLWGTYYGGGAWEKLTDIKHDVDASGNAFVAGNTLSSTTFPLVNPGGGAYFQGTYGGGAGIQGKGGDICILKFSNTGVLLWATYYGGTSHDNGNGIVVDGSGDIYITGNSVSTNFPLQNLAGAYNQSTFGGGTTGGTEAGDVVVLKFTNAGVRLWATYYGGSGDEVGRSITCDASNNIILTGWTKSSNFPTLNPGGGTYYQGTYGGNTDAIYVRFTPSGAQQWSTYYGGSASDIGHYIDMDPTGNILSTGETTSSNFPTLNPGGTAYFQGTFGGGISDAYLIRMSNAGATQWATYYGGSGLDIGRGITPNIAGDIYVTGQTGSTNFPTLNPGSGAYFSGTNSGSNDAFYLRFDKNFARLWATYFGGSSNEDGCAIICDPCGNVYGTGHTYSANMPTLNPGGGAYYIGTKLATDDVFFTSFGTGNNMIWATFNGTSGFDEKGTSLRIDPSGRLVAVGYWCFYSVSNGVMNPGGGAYYKLNTDADDFFIAKWESAAAVNCISLCSFNAGGTYSCFPPSSTAFTFSISSITGFTSTPSFTWSGPGSYTSNLQNPVIPNGTFGTYTVVGTDGNCTVTKTVSITDVSITPTLTSSGTITCNNSSTSISANTVSPGYSYGWGGPSIIGPNSTQSITAGAAGIYTCVITNTATGCAQSNTIAVSSDMSTPAMTVTPITQTLNCNGGCKTFTATSTSTTNIVGTWFDPAAVPVVGPSGTPLILCAGAPGTYTALFCSTINGCCASQTVAVFTTTSVPTITVTPNTNNGFTINCTNPTVAMSINSSGTLAPTGYTWTNLSTSVSVSPANGGYTVTVPGQYEAAFHDGNFCTVTTTVTIYIDTIKPPPFAMTNLPSNSYTLTCYTPSLIATAMTNPMLSAGSYSWVTPPNLIMSSNTVTVSMINVTSSTSPTSYTVLAMGSNGCVGRQKVNFYKDIYVPPYSLVFTPTAITCANPNVAVSPNSLSSSTVPVSFTVTSPPPTGTVTTAGALVYVAGQYTMTYQSNVNGCMATTTASVPLNVVPPATVALAPVVLPCGQTTTVISAGTTTTSTSYSYTWNGPPLAGMSCPGGVNCNTTSVNMPGTYDVYILNTTNGCYTENFVTVVPGTLIASFNTNPPTGFAPLTVSFDNTSVLGSSTSGSVTTVWNYGNGISTTTIGSSASYSLTGPPDGGTIYQSAGSYTVMLIVTQITGSATCVGTATALVVVDLESEMEIPNVFTPNGDGVNDFFTLNLTNITELQCTIFDRWGVKMHDVETDKGLIKWDGKNLENKDVPAGTYFYIIKAKGKDGKDFNFNGYLSLYR